MFQSNLLTSSKNSLNYKSASMSKNMDKNRDTMFQKIFNEKQSTNSNKHFITQNQEFIKEII